MTKKLAFLCALAAGAACAAVPMVDSNTLALAFDDNTRIVTVTYDLKDAPGIVTADFLTNGGIKEQMSAARRNWREEHGMGYLNGRNGNNGRDGNNGSANGIPQPTTNDPKK